MQHARTLGALICLTVLATWLGIGDVSVNLANRIAEDTPVLFARYFASPAHWAGDWGMLNARLYTLGSVCNWLPALLWRDFGVAPEWPTLLLCYLQNLLIVIGAYLLAGHFTRRTELRALAALFVMTASPEQWNPSLFSRSFTSVYPAEMAQGMILIGAWCLLSGRELAALAIICLAGFVHVSLSVMTGLFFGLYFLLSRNIPGSRPLFWRLGALALAVAIFLARAAIVSRGVGDVVDHAHMIEILKGSGHVYPWLVAWAWRRVPPVMLTLAGFTAIIFWAHRRAPVTAPRLRAFFQAALLLTPLLFVAYAAGIFLEIPAIEKLTFTRYIGILLTFAVPHVIVALDAAMESCDSLAVAGATTSLLLLAGHGFGLFVPPLIALVRPRNPRIGFAILGAWFIALFASPLLGEGGQTLRAWLAPGIYLSPTRLLVTVAITAVFVAATRLKRDRAWVTYVTFATVAIWLLQDNVATRKSAAETMPRDLRDAQIWAGANTADDAVFLLTSEEMPWRTLSNRRVVTSSVGPGIYYSGNRPQYEHLQRVKAFLARYDAKGVTELKTQESLMAFAREFGGDYLVTESSRPLDLPRVFGNASLAIYQLRGRK